MVATSLRAAERLGRGVAGERLLGVAGVARAEHGRPGRRPGGQLVAAGDQHRLGEPVGEGGDRKVPAHSGAADAAGERRRRLHRAGSGGLDPPERVAQVIRHCADRVQHVPADHGHHETGRSSASPARCPRMISCPSPITAPSSSAPDSTVTPPLRMLSATLGPVLDHAAVEQHRALDHGARADPAAGADHARLAQLRIGRDLGLLPHDHRSVEALADHGLDPALEDVPVRLQEAVRRPDVDPVALEPDPVEAVADQAAGRPRARSRPRGRAGSRRGPSAPAGRRRR